MAEVRDEVVHRLDAHGKTHEPGGRRELRPGDGATLGTFSLAGQPEALTFDGANIWAALANVDKVAKVRASDGTVLGTFSAGSGPVGAAFDGANIWVTNFNDNTVSKL